jgi:hypothetical protein
MTAINIHDDAAVAALFDHAMHAATFDDLGRDGLDGEAMLPDAEFHPEMFAGLVSEGMGGQWTVADILTTLDRTDGLEGDAKALQFLAHFQLQRAQGFPGL